MKAAYYTALGLAALWCAVRLLSILYDARTAYRHELLERFTARRLTLWPSRLTPEWIVEQAGIELARNEQWELAVQEALNLLARQESEAPW
jgi:hypothetical protein